MHVLSRLFGHRERAICNVITPVGPGHEELARESKASVEAAWAAGHGPFTAFGHTLVDDSAGKLGRSRARNIGVQEATRAGAQWLFFLDADDLLAKDAFSRFGRYGSNYDAVWGLIAEGESQDDAPRLRFPQILSLDERDELALFDPFMTLQMGHFVRAAVAAECPFDETLDAGEDFDYYVRVWSRYRCAKVPEMFFVNRRGRTSGGPRGASALQWRSAALERLAAARKAGGVSEDSTRSLALRNARASEAQQFCRSHELASEENYLHLAERLPYHGVHEVTLDSCAPFVMYSDNDDRFLLRRAWIDDGEPYSSRVWRTLASAASSILDIGAGTGYYALAAARAAPAASIVAWEPSPWAYSRLRRNLDLSNARAVRALCAAEAPQSSSSELVEAERADVALVELLRDEAWFTAAGLRQPTLIRLPSTDETANAMKPMLVRSTPDLFVNLDGHAASALVEATNTRRYRWYRIDDAQSRVMDVAASDLGAATTRYCFATVRPQNEIEELVAQARRD